MTGGGFGGCTVNLVAVDETAAFVASLHDRYRQATGIEPTIFVSEPSDGVQELGTININLPREQTPFTVWGS